MKIIKTKEITPTYIKDLDEDLRHVFANRSRFHTGHIPEFYVYIQEKAWKEFLEYGNSIYQTSRHEAQGIMLGKYVKDQHGEFLIATHFEKGEGTSSATYVEMPSERVAEISETAAKKDLLMLIWLHTHPNFGVFYSSTDINCLKSNFYKRHHIGIVADIIRKESLGFKVAGSQVNQFTDYLLLDPSGKIAYKPFAELIHEEKRGIPENGQPELTQSIPDKKELVKIQQNTLIAIDKANERMAELEKTHRKLENHLNQELKNKIEDGFSKLNEDHVDLSKGSTMQLDALLQEIKQNKNSLNFLINNLDDTKAQLNEFSENISSMEEGLKKTLEKYKEQIIKLYKSDTSNFLKLISNSRRNGILLLIIAVLMAILTLLTGIQFVLQ